MATLKTRIAAVVGAIAIGLPGVAACGSGDSGDNVTVQYASHIGDSAIHSLQAQWMMDRIVELTDGKVEFKAHYSASLLGGEEVMAGMQDGRVDMAYWAPAYNPAQMPLSQAAGVPFVSVNPAAYSEALRQVYDDNEDFSSEFSKNGIHVLNFLGTPSSVLGSNNPVLNVDDLDGLKVRSVGLQALALEEAGSEVAAIPLNDSIESLERGLFEAYSGTTMDAALSLGLPDVTTEMTAPGTGIPALTVLAVSESKFKAWPKDVQEAFVQAGEELYEQAPVIAVEEGKNVCTALKQAGVTVTAWSDADVQSWASEFGDDGVNAWLKSATDAGVDKAKAEAFYEELTLDVKAKEADSDYVDAVLACAEQK